MNSTPDPPHCIKNSEETTTIAYTRTTLAGALSGKVSLRVRALAAAYSGTANVTSKALTVHPAPPEIVLSRSTLAVTEGVRGTYGVRLNKPPTGTVVVSVSSAGTAASAAPATLTCNATSWNTAQTVAEDGEATYMVEIRERTDRAGGGVNQCRRQPRRARDAGAGAVHGGQLEHGSDGAGGRSDADAPGGEGGGATVTVTDDAGVVISRRTVTVLVGETNTYTVRLEAAPAGTVTVTSGTPEQAAVGPTDILVVDPRGFALLEGVETTYTVRLARVPGGASALSHYFGASCRWQFPGSTL